MTSHLPTNCTLSCPAKALTGLAALRTPASPEITAIQGAPVGRLFDITFDSPHPELAEGDLLIDEADATKRYRIKAPENWETHYLAHTHCLAEGGL